MNTQPRVLRLAVLIASCGGLAANLLADSNASRHYVETDLVSDVPGLAAATDAALVNPWGLTSSATSPWWVADNGAGISTLYNGAGGKLGLVVTVPNLAGVDDPSAPTGVVFNGVSTEFLVGAGMPARFIFCTEAGTIAGWNSGTTAVQMVDNSGWASYKGMTLASNNGANMLYAADFATGTVDVFDSGYNPVALGPWAFKDPTLPDDYGPFNVQAVGDEIYVMFAQKEEDSTEEVAGAGNGAVAVFSPAGVLLRRLHRGPWLNAPWGLAVAPVDFGKFSGMILVGNFGSGQIAVYDPASGNFRGLLRAVNGKPFEIEGLWALRFGNGAGAGPANSLYFTAGIDDEAHGLFGTITSVPGKGQDDE